MAMGTDDSSPISAALKAYDRALLLKTARERGE
jgi:hypothetical protein